MLKSMMIPVTLMVLEKWSFQGVESVDQWLDCAWEAFAHSAANLKVAERD